MDDFPGLLARDYGFRPQQGKSAPMSASKSSSIGSGSGSGSGYAPTRSANPISSFDDVFGGPPKYPAQNQNPNPPPPPSFDSIFDEFKDPKPSPSPSPNPKWSSMPVYDKPVYDDDIFEGVPGVKIPAKVEYDDVFASISKGGHVEKSGAYDDLLGGLGRSSSSRTAESKRSDDLGGFEELIPGFGGSSPPSRRDPQATNQQKSSVPSAKPSATMSDDPFVVLETTSASVYPSSGMFTDPLERLGRPTNSGSVNIDASLASGGILDDIDAFDGLSKSVPTFTYEKNETRKDRSPLKSGQNRSSVESFDNCIPKTQSTKSFDSKSTVQSPQSNDGPYERNATADLSPKSSEHLETADDVWLTVAEIPLFTQPTSALPPSRPPPPLVLKSAPYGKTDPRRKDNDTYSQSSPGYPYPKGSMRRPSASPIDELGDFVTNKPQSNEDADNISSEDDVENNSAAAASAAAMKEAMDRAEAKFKHAKEVRERERDARSARRVDFAQERDEDVAPDNQDWEDKMKQEKIDRERLQREREEREREQRRLEREREGRQAVERATREARERAAAEARAKADRQAVEKANAEARQRAERAAVQRAQQEARERAATEAKERAARERERAAVDRAAAEARQRAERAAVEKANAQARERAAAEAREKAAKEKQVKTENDLENFFTTTNRPTSAPKERENRNPFEAQPPNRTSTDGTKQTTSTYSNTVKKTASTPNMVDDLASIFGGVPSSSGGVPSSSGVFQEVEGEPEERRRSRLEKHQRTLERAAKALAEKNERDMQVQRDQAERHRISETLDTEIKRWSAGKEGNLRALLSTLQYVLWPECGWQPVSLTDLIEASKVKRIYRKATLCIHPDKVQQKGANIQQKYIAEKVFDLLKEAWNKFNSEELF